jgi:myo-inositol 2-dehydrogenase / D-chiro-inositol 1-dehydrogenase
MDQETFDRPVDELLAAFRRGEEPPVQARTGHRVLELAFAAVQSFETGRRVATA